MWTRAGPDRDADVEREGRAHKQQVDGKLIHVLRSLILVDAVFAVELVHPPGVEEDQRQEDEDRALLGEPEAQIGAADFDARQQRAQQDAEPEETRAPR
jgi:hypothetical protein